MYGSFFIKGMENIVEYTTDRISIYDVNGNVIDEIDLPEKITPIPAKRTGISDKGLFYKGSGVVYQKHLVNRLENNIKKIGNSGLLYEKYIVTYPNLIGKYGIFKFRHQPIFDDLEGGCGTKELKILDNSINFELSAIDEIINVINTGIGNSNIYVYKMKEVKASPKDVITLIEYILSTDYNTAWDKNLWTDIYCYKYVRDIADWFKSNKGSHKLGTIYALLNSMYVNDIYLYIELIQHIFGKCNTNKLYVLYYSGLIVNKYCKDKIKVDLTRYDEGNYSELLKLLFSGKACCHLVDDDKWNWVREYYMEKVSTYVQSVAMRKIL